MTGDTLARIATRITWDFDGRSAFHWMEDRTHRTMHVPVKVIVTVAALNSLAPEKSFRDVVGWLHVYAEHRDTIERVAGRKYKNDAEEKNGEVAVMIDRADLFG
jgi:hypothetical protein